jgi:hypothetical protein
MQAPTLEAACNSVASVMTLYPKSSAEVKMESSDKCTIDLTVPNPRAPSLPMVLTTSFTKNGSCTPNHLCLTETIPSAGGAIPAKFTQSASGEVYLVLSK